jgi:predicted enzyme related to lactoylglutathione lyase
MLDKSKVFSSFSVNDIDRAREFYSKTLGLKVSDDPMGFLELHLEGNSTVIIYGKPDHSAATFTVLNFQVHNLEEAVEDLTKKGVQFLRYSGDLQTDDKGIHYGDKQSGEPDIAWFTDPAGNILSVVKDNNQNI